MDKFPVSSINAGIIYWDFKWFPLLSPSDNSANSQIKFNVSPCSELKKDGFLI